MQEESDIVFHIDFQRHPHVVIAKHIHLNPTYVIPSDISDAMNLTQRLKILKVFLVFDILSSSILPKPIPVLDAIK